MEPRCGLEPHGLRLEHQVAALIDSYRQPTGLSQQTGAGEEIRTPDIFLGKEVLYQLSYARSDVRTFSPQTTFTPQFYLAFILAADHLPGFKCWPRPRSVSHC